MPSFPIFHVDAFTSELFRGNPAAVCVTDRWLEPELMQNIAAENNLSETAFVMKEGGSYRICWYAPDAEVALCGHATLATAFVIHKFFDKDAVKLSFHSKDYRLSVAILDDQYQLDFPMFRYKERQLGTLPKELQSASVQECYEGNDTLVLRLNSRSAVETYEPPLEFIKRNNIFLAITGRTENESYDFVSRFFLPSIGISEDPVTGSLHCLLGPIWSDKLDKKVLKAYQASKRGGEINLQLAGDRVLLKGKAILFKTGEIVDIA